MVWEWKRVWIKHLPIDVCVFDFSQYSLDAFLFGPNNCKWIRLPANINGTSTFFYFVQFRVLYKSISTSIISDLILNVSVVVVVVVISHLLNIIYKHCIIETAHNLIEMVGHFHKSSNISTIESTVKCLILNQLTIISK